MPWPVQLLEQTARFSQPYPEKPGAQAQLPLWQRPLPLQLRGQAAGASKEVKCAVSDQAPEEHKPDGSKLPLRAEAEAIGSGMEVEGTLPLTRHPPYREISEPIATATMPWRGAG